VRRRDYERYYERYLPAIKGIARKLAGSDNELAEDLEQQGALELLQLQPAKATRNESAWIRQALKRRMIDFLRKYNPAIYQSLDARLENGDQVERNANGQLTLLSSHHPAPRLHCDPDEGWNEDE